jgi:hypothetical protein
MKVVDTYVTTQYCSTRKGGTCDVQKHTGHVNELYAPALKSGDWYLIKFWVVFEGGSELETQTVIVKR